jgi:hypothetical protein
MPATTFGRQKIGNHAIGKTSWTMPTLYAALYATDPGDSGSQTSEITQFARIEVTSKFGSVDASGVSTSTADINFGSPASDGSPAAYIGYLDASSGGNMIFREAIPNPRAIIAGARPVKFTAGQATIRFI